VARVRWWLALVILVVACAQRPQPAVTAPTQVPQAEASPSATGTPLPTSTPDATAATGRVQGIETAGLGTVTGEWVFVLNLVRPTAGLDYDREVWAISADGRTSRRLVVYTPGLGGGLDFVGQVTDNLARQLSPDGRHLVIAAYVPSGTANNRIVSIEIATGRAVQLTTDTDSAELEPAWSPDGSLIAFARVSRTDPRTGRSIWVMRPDGTGLRQLVPLAGTILGFTADGRDLCFGLACIELASGQVRRFAGEMSGGAGASWRTAQGAWRTSSPNFVGAFSKPARLAVADGPGSALRTVVEGNFMDPRWRPGAEEILCLSAGGDLWGDPWVFKAGGAGRKLLPGTIVRRAEWSRDGSSIFLIAADARIAPLPPAFPPATDLRRVAADGSSAVELFRPSRADATGLVDLASFTYK